MAEADPFRGAHEFFRVCRKHGITVNIISHKTRHPFIGEPYDLHAAAQDWLVRQGFLSPDGAGLSSDQIFFELTKSAKLARIAACGCTHFIDDLPEILNDAAFPANTAQLLFAPASTTTRIAGSHVYSTWPELQSHLLALSKAATDLLAAAIQPAALARLLNRFDGEIPHTLEPLAGGANNRVYRARTTSGHDYIVKQYFTPANDTRDRFQSEHSFYSFAWETARVRCIPEPLAWDETARLGAFALIEGTRPEQATAEDVNAALDFFTQLNAARTRAAAIQPAAETCHTLAEHIATVRSRMDRLADIAGSVPIDTEARSFVRDELFPAWQHVLHDPTLEAALVDDTDDSGPLPRCVSPSDFGFHNTKRQPDGSLVFFDFEYAGGDDPAKVVCDFFCQPAVPAPAECYDHFVACIAAAIGCASPAVLAARCRLLLPVYQLKWCTIMLNEFLPPGNSRRRFAGTADIVARKTRQLAKATAALHQTLAFAS
jgi:hypothetical protein